MDLQQPAPNRLDYECWPLGDQALVLRFGAKLDEALNNAVHGAVAALRSAHLPGVLSIAPSFASLVLTLDIPVLARHGGVSSLTRRIDAILRTAPQAPRDVGPVIDIPTRYGGSEGPDLDEVAARLQLSTEELIERHSSASYRVAMVGFLPGFPYLLGLPESLHLVRRSSVRARVPAGSVAIAGAQAGIYPSESPGGWHVLGRTELRLFDPAAAAPARLMPGDRVRFVRVER